MMETDEKVHMIRHDRSIVDDDVVTLRDVIQNSQKTLCIFLLTKNR